MSRQSASPSVIFTSVPGAWFGRYGCPDLPRDSDVWSGVITQSEQAPFTSHREIGRDHDPELNSPAVLNLTQADRMSLFNGRAWKQRYTSPEAFRHLMDPETRVTPSRYRSMARCWLSSLSPGCLCHFFSGCTTLIPTTQGSVIALPPCKVKTLKTFLDFSAFDHYQHLPAPSRKALQLAGSAPILRAPCHTRISGSPACCVAECCFA